MPSSDKIKISAILDTRRDSIMEQFHSRCIRCSQLAVCVHEVVFRSEGDESVDTGVPLCHPCHEWAHQKDKINRQKELFRLRNEALKRYATE